MIRNVKRPTQRRCLLSEMSFIIPRSQWSIKDREQASQNQVMQVFKSGRIVIFPRLFPHSLFNSSTPILRQHNGKILLPVLLWPELLYAPEQLLIFGCHLALKLLDIFFWWQFFRLNPTIFENLPHALVVLHMFRCNRWLPFEIIFLHVEVRNLRCKVLCFDSDGREEIRQRTAARNLELLLHIGRCEPAEKCLVAFASDPGKTLTVNSPVEDQAGKLLLGERQFLSRLHVVPRR